jgi:proline iminopeptidase
MLLHTETVGGDGPVVLAVPGGPGFDHGYLRPGLDPLGAEARVVYVDLRNTGGSQRGPLDEWTLEQTADDLAELDLGPAVVFGHSAGGFTALLLALRYPDLVRGLILASTSPTFGAFDDPEPPPTLESRAGAEAAAIAGRLFGGDASPATLMAFALDVATYYSGPEHMDVPPYLFSLSQIENDVTQHFFSQLASHYDVREQLITIDVPALVVVGSWDWVVPPSRGRELARGLPQAELLELTTAGHFAFYEEHEAFLAATRALLASV